jgi:hypothetical protein
MSAWMPRHRRAAALPLGVLVFVLAGMPAGMAQDPPQPATGGAPLGSLVLVTAAGTRGGQPQQATAVGVVLDPSGLVLAPASVVAPDAPGVAVLYGDPGLGSASVNQIVVSLGDPGSGDELHGRPAEVIAADGYLDLAILRIDEARGSPPLRLTAMGLGERLPDAGDAVSWTSLGGGPIATRSELKGSAGQALTDDRIPDGPAWLPTTIEPGDGLPGGALVGANGELLACPAWAPGLSRATVDGRPAALIAPLLEAAQRGAAYASPYVTPGSGQEALAFDTWATAEDACLVAADDRGPVMDYPTGAPRITAVFAWSGFTDGEDLLTYWYDADPEATSPLLLSTPDFWRGESDGDCYSLSIFMGDGSALADGAYGLLVTAGGQLRTVGDATTTIGGRVADATVQVSGRVVNADTGKGIKEAWVVILVQGTEIQDWLENPSERQIAASGTTDKKGYYETAPAIPPGDYPFIVFAEGYRIIGGSLDLTGGSFLPDFQLTKAG